MAIIIDLEPDLEERLRQEAERTGIRPNAFVIRTIEERLGSRARARLPDHLTEEEALLLQEVNQGLPEVTWQEYHDLIAKRRDESLTETEHIRLIELTQVIEDANVERISQVAKLAQLRNVPLDKLMRQMGVTPRKV